MHEQVGGYILTAAMVAIGIGVIVGISARAYDFDAPMMGGRLANQLGAPDLAGFLFGEPLFTERPGSLMAAGAPGSETIGEGADQAG